MDPTGVALDANNNVYVADTQNQRIIKFAPNRATVIQVWTTTNPSLNYPEGVTLDNSNNLYNADLYNNRIVKFSPNGTLIQTFSTTNPTLNEPLGVAVDSSNNLYVSDIGNGRIVKFASNGTVIQTLTTTNPSLDPRGVALDSSGNVYVVDNRNNRGVKFAPNGTVIQIWTANPALNAPVGIALDASNNVYVADLYNNRIVKFSPTGALLSILTTTNPTLLYPWGVAVDPSNNVYVTDLGNIRVVVFYFQLCPLGYYCAGLTSTALLCPAGYYCPSQTLYAPTVTLCPSGVSCPPGTSSLPIPSSTQTCVSLLTPNVTVGSAAAVYLTDPCQFFNMTLLVLRSYAIAPVCRFYPSLFQSPGNLLLNTTYGTSSDVSQTLIACPVSSLLPAGTYVIQLSLDGGSTFKLPVINSLGIMASTLVVGSPNALSSNGTGALNNATNTLNALTVSLQHGYNPSVDVFPIGYNVGDMQLITWRAPVEAPVYLTLLMEVTFVSSSSTSQVSLPLILSEPCYVIGNSLFSNQSSYLWSVPNITTILKSLGVDLRYVVSLAIGGYYSSISISENQLSTRGRRLLFTKDDFYGLVGLVGTILGGYALSIAI